MKKSKKISDIYREKFKGVEITPPEDVWQNISNSLPEKEHRKRILPVWYAIAGAAAMLLFLLLFQNEKETNFHPNYNYIVSEEETIKSLDVEPTSNFYQKTLSEASGLLEKLMRQPVNSSKLANSEEYVTNKTEIDEIQSKDIRSLNELEPATVSGTASISTFSLPAESFSVESKEIQDIELAFVIGNEHSKSKIQREQELAADEKSALADRFSITTSAAAVYLDNTGGNAFAQGVQGNPGGGEVSIAYGINFKYRLSEKISIRTGVTKMELSHSSSDLPGSSISSTGIRASESPARSTTLAAPVIGYLHQTMDYIEVPMEVEYNVIQQKVGLDLIGGISTLFLNDNMVSLNSPVATTNLGAGDNLNNLSFSTNIGLGINYLILPQVRLNLEPMFKYQLNTFDGIDGLNPYYFGIYTGLNYKF